VSVLSRIVWVLIGIAVFCFAILAVNQEHAALKFLVWQTPEISLFWWLLLAFVLGLVVGGTTVGLVSLKHRFHERALARELAEAQRELGRLKIPAA